MTWCEGVKQSQSLSADSWIQMIVVTAYMRSTLCILRICYIIIVQVWILDSRHNHFWSLFFFIERDLHRNNRWSGLIFSRCCRIAHMFGWGFLNAFWSYRVAPQEKPCHISCSRVMTTEDHTSITQTHGAINISGLIQSSVHHSPLHHCAHSECLRSAFLQTMPSCSCSGSTQERMSSQWCHALPLVPVSEKSCASSLKGIGQLRRHSPSVKCICSARAFVARWWWNRPRVRALNPTVAPRWENIHICGILMQFNLDQVSSSFSGLIKIFAKAQK